MNKTDERTPPHSVEAEQGVLGSMLQPHGGSEAIAEASVKIGAEYLYVPAHRTIFTTLVDLYDAGQAIDLITFTQSLCDKNLLDAVGGAGFITHLATFVPTATNVAHYLDIVRDKYILREAVAAGTELVRRAYEEQENPQSVLDVIESKIGSIRSIHGRNGSDLPPMEDAAELITKRIELPSDVIEGILHRAAKMVLGGGSKTFKTWTLVDLAISVATGTAWMGKFPTKRGCVLYINLELQGAFFAKRLFDVCAENQITLESGSLRTWNLRGRACDLSKLRPLLLRAIERDKYALIIIDPIYKLLGLRDENKAGDIASLVNEIEAIAVETGAAIAFGAHYSKGNQAGKEVIDRIGGSGVFARDPDSILNFTRHEEENCFTVDATLRNHPPIKSFVARWDYPLMCVDSLLDPDRLKQAGAAVKQYHSTELLDLLERPMFTGEFKKTAKTETGMSDRTFYRLYGELKSSGALTLDAEGKLNRK